MLHLKIFVELIDFMPPTADSKYSWLRLERWFEVSGRSAVLCRLQSYLEDGNLRQKERQSQKKSFEYRIVFPLHFSNAT